MASIEIDSKSVVKACEIAFKHLLGGRKEIEAIIKKYGPQPELREEASQALITIENISRLAKYSTDYMIDINENDFVLIGKYLP